MHGEFLLLAGPAPHHCKAEYPRSYPLLCTRLLQAELEDLCFAVLQPAAYTTIRSQLDELWGISSQAPNTLPAHLPPPPALQPSKLPQTSQPEPGSQAKLPLLAAAARLQLPSPPFKPAEPAAAKPGGLIGEDPVQLPGFMHDCPTMYIDEGAQRPSRDGSASASTIPLTMTDDEAWAQVRAQHDSKAGHS